MNEITLKKQAMELAASLIAAKTREHAKKATAQTIGQMEAAQAGLNRAARFVPINDGKAQCPNCWIRNGRGSALTETSEGRWTCSVCFTDYEAEG